MKYIEPEPVATNNNIPILYSVGSSDLCIQILKYSEDKYMVSWEAPPKEYATSGYRRFDAAADKVAELIKKYDKKNRFKPPELAE